MGSRYGSIIFIIFVIPSLFSASLIILGNTVTMEENIIKNIYSETTSGLLLSENLNTSDNCLKIIYTNGSILINNATKVNAYIILLSMHDYKAVSHRKLNNKNSSPYISLSETFMLMYNIHSNTSIEIILSNQSKIFGQVNYVHRGKGFLVYPIIITSDNVTALLNSSNYIDTNICFVERHTWPYEISSFIGCRFIYTLEAVSYIYLIMYGPIIFFGVYIIIRKLEAETRILHYMGVSSRVLLISRDSAILIIGILSSIIGIAGGVLFAHLSLWFLRFFGIYIGSRPIIGWTNAFKIIITLAILVSISIITIELWRHRKQ